MKLTVELELMKGVQFPMEPDFEDLFYYTGGDLPTNFQMLNVEKYDGNTCPWMHLRMYYNAMFQWGNNEWILVQMFGRGLEKDTVKWCKCIYYKFHE